MKKLFIVTFCLLLYSVPAMAEGLAIANFGNATQVDLAIPGRAGYQTCISEIQYDANDATDDIAIWWRLGDRAVAILASDKDATASTFITTTDVSVNGVGTTATVVFQRADGEYAEFALLSGYVTTTATVTAAVTVDFKKGDKMYEMTASGMQFNNIGTAATVLENEHGLFCGPVDSPILLLGEAGVFYEQVFAFYKRPEGDKPVGWLEGATDQTIALPGAKGKRIIVTGWGADANADTDNLEIYTSTGLTAGVAKLTATAAAGQTDVTVTGAAGFGSTTDYAFLIRADGTVAELIDLTSITGTAVVVADNLQNAFKVNDLLIEAELLLTLDNLGTDAFVRSNEHGLLTGGIGEPLGFKADDGSSILDYVIGYYENATAPRRTLAIASADFLSTSTDNIGSHLALPGFEGKRTCITGVSFDVTTASDDLAFWVAVQPVDMAILKTALDATDTDFVFKQPGSDDDITDTAQMVIQRPDGIYAETFDFTSAVDNDSGVATDGIQNAFPAGSKMFEMETSTVYNTNILTVGTDAVTYEKDDGFFCGPPGSPVAVTLAGTDSIVLYLTGFSE